MFNDSCVARLALLTSATSTVLNIAPLRFVP